MDFKDFIYYVVLGLKHIQAEKKQANDKNPITAKQLSSATWLMYYVYDLKEAKEKAEKILNNLELDHG